MSAEKVAGFWSSLQLLTDNSSFKKGLTALKNVEKGLKEVWNMSKKAFAIGGAITSFAGIMSMLANKNTVMALTLGMGVTEMKNFKYASELAGVSGDEFIDSLQGIKQAQLDIANGDWNSGMLMGMARLGMNPEDLKGKSVGELTKSVFSTAQQNPNNLNGAEIEKQLQLILGQAGLQIYLSAKDLGTSFEGLMGSSKKLMSTNNKTAETERLLNLKMRSLKIIMEEQSNVFTEGFAKGIMPGLDVDQYANNPAMKEELTAKVMKLGEDIGALIGTLASKLPGLLDLIEKVFTKIDSIIGNKGKKQGETLADSPFGQLFEDDNTKAISQHNLNMGFLSSDSWNTDMWGHKIDKTKDRGLYNNYLKTAINAVNMDLKSGAYSDSTVRAQDIKLVQELVINDKTDNGIKVSVEKTMKAMNDYQNQKAK